MKKAWPYVIEVARWALVLFLLAPVLHPRGGRWEFTRVLVGEALLVIFIGKLFYDTVIWKFTRQRRTAGRDILSMLGMLVAVGLVVVLFVLLVGATLMRYFQGLSAREGLLP